MKLVISVLFFLVNSLSFSCEINRTTDIISLSGPITHLLRELNLLKKPVVGISEFNGISEKEFSGTIFKGGMFLSPQALKSLNRPLLFFDESLEQRKTIKKLGLDGIELITKNQDPFQAYELSKQKLLPYLKNCQEQLIVLQKKVETIKSNIAKSEKYPGRYFFYLGAIKKDGRRPNLIMIDNFVLSLLNNQLIKTYPSPLNYVPWSEKIIHQYEQNQMEKVFSIGLVTSAKEKTGLELTKVSDHEFNFSHPALLVPGLAQVNFLEELVRKLPH